MVNSANGGRVAKFGFAVNNRKKNQASGAGKTILCFSTSRRTTATRAVNSPISWKQYLKKGHQVFLECSLKLDSWNDKTSGEKRSKLSFVVNDMQFLEPKSESANSEGGPRLGVGSAPARWPENHAPRNGVRPTVTTTNPNQWNRRRGAAAEEEDIPFLNNGSNPEAIGYGDEGKA